jgi:hypothetical protein
MTGEETYSLFRQELVSRNVMEKHQFGMPKAAPHWYELEEPFKQAWEAVARHTDEQHQRQMAGIRQLMHRDPNRHGTPREGEHAIRY